MKKIHLKRKLKPINIFAVFLLLTLISLYIVFNQIKEKIMPSLFKYGSLEAKKFSSIIINDAIDKYITEKQNIIQKLDAYKKSLIFEYVTGKRLV